MDYIFLLFNLHMQAIGLRSFLDGKGRAKPLKFKCAKTSLKTLVTEQFYNRESAF